MDWQQITALALVAAAFLWLLRTQLFPRGNRTGCGTCGGCASPPPRPSTLISADELTVLPAARSVAPQEGITSREDRL
jgi:hypothetical protein